MIAKGCWWVSLPCYVKDCVKVVVAALVQHYHQGRPALVAGHLLAGSGLGGLVGTGIEASAVAFASQNWLVVPAVVAANRQRCGLGELSGCLLASETQRRGCPGSYSLEASVAVWLVGFGLVKGCSPYSTPFVVCHVRLSGFPVVLVGPKVGLRDVLSNGLVEGDVESPMMAWLDKRVVEGDTMPRSRHFARWPCFIKAGKRTTWWKEMLSPP